MRFIIEALNLNPKEEVCFCAFTGKAASVLKSKGNPNSVTAHKLLYEAVAKPDGTFIFTPKLSFEKPYKLVVVDEVSMLPKSLWNLLLRHQTHIIALGDPMQLESVSKDDNNDILLHPHVFLDEVLRQAKESEIIRLSMYIREGKPLSGYKGENEQVQIYRPEDLSLGMMQWADQVLCATNARRHQINNTVREAKGFGPEPEVGDKIIALSNHWDFMSDSKEWSLTNGCIGEIESFYKKTEYPHYRTGLPPVDYLITNMTFEEEHFTKIPIDYKCLLTGQPTLNNQQIFQWNSKIRNKGGLRAPFDFAYAYAVTVWKYQGSQADNILGIEEGFPYGREHVKYLYTMCTRAASKLVLITQN